MNELSKSTSMQVRGVKIFLCLNKTSLKINQEIENCKRKFESEFADGDANSHEINGNSEPPSKKIKIIQPPSQSPLWNVNNQIQL